MFLENASKRLQRQSWRFACLPLLAALLLHVNCGGTASQANNPSPPAAPVETQVEVFRAGLNFPVKLAFAPDGRLFFTEKSGQIRIIQNGQLLDQPFATLDAATAGERGVLGIAFDPQYNSNHFVYVYFSHPSGPNRVVRFTDSNNSGTELTTIVDGIASSQFHNAGNIGFDSSGHLIVSTGDAENPASSQDPNSRNGKLLRFNRDGSIPPDNPFGSSNPVMAMGLRNPFDFTFHPQTGALYATDNGPDCDDKLLRVVPGGNYGWRPNYPCGDSDPRFSRPIRLYSESIAPTGVIFYTGTALPQFKGDMLVVQWNGGRMRHLRIDEANQGNVTSEEIVLDGGFGGLIDIAQGPEGYVYFNTNNAILRLRPK
jgi:glucose/arabinose dehydrogenase